nr:hypothetical protein [uncultured Dyadobacter sp.]
MIKYLIERFGIGAGPNSASPQNLRPSTTRPSDNQPLLASNNQQFTDFSESKIEEYPSLKDLLIKSYPKNESEWILCYAFDASKQGTEVFGKQDIINLYKENGRWEKNTNNFGQNLMSCIKKDWIKSISSTDFVFKPSGLSYVKEILTGNSTGKEVKSVKRKNNPNKRKVEDA